MYETPETLLKSSRNECMSSVVHTLILTVAVNLLSLIMLELSETEKHVTTYMNTYHPVANILPALSYFQVDCELLSIERSCHAIECFR